ncbi:C-C motif chemokine 17-like [Anguilla anguilla]|uniref:C-C motif chemokine 17-like n=1 Tax=Anguilla anguilla TaxID=7936 RepID=UPI0015A8AD4F|nr:C-C motif chemokine 17-like [Anguilla anguilla]
MNTAMKMSALLIVMLLGSLELVSSDKDSWVGADCCTRYERKRIPLPMVVSWHETSSSCAKAAVVFVTELGRRLCLNPSEGWVRSHMTQVDSGSRKVTTVSIKTISRGPPH